jgi:hypothetical protein
MPESAIFFFLDVLEACGTKPFKQLVSLLFPFTPLPGKVTQPKYLCCRIKLVRVLIRSDLEK